MSELLQKYLSLKDDLRLLRKELSDELKKDPDYADLKEGVREASEALSAHRRRLMDTTAIGAVKARIDAKRDELAVAKAAVRDSLVVTDKSTGAVVQMAFNF